MTSDWFRMYNSTHKKDVKKSEIRKKGRGGEVGRKNHCVGGKYKFGHCIV